MRRPLLGLLSFAGAIALAACQAGPAPEAELTPTALPASQTPVAAPTPRTPSTVAGVLATPVRVATTSRVLPTATPSPTPGTPTPTPTPAPSAGLIMEASALQEKFDAFNEAVASGDKDALLKAQRALLDEIPKAEMAAAGDESKAAAAFLSGLRDLRSALGGDLAKLDGAAKGIAAVTGGTTARQGSTTVTASTTVQPITSLPRYAQDLADQVAAFRKAQDEGNVGDLLRLQNSLFAQLDRGDAALKNSHTKDAETIRGALGDLRDALGGDGVKFESAEAKLRQVGETSGGTAAKKTTTATKQVDLQPVANDLNNKLDSYQRAVDNADKDAIAKAQKELTDQVAKAEAAIKNDQSPRAAKLRDVLGSIREAAAGDQSKIDAAKSALDSLMSGQ